MRNQWRLLLLRPSIPCQRPHYSCRFPLFQSQSQSQSHFHSHSVCHGHFSSLRDSIPPPFIYTSLLSQLHLSERATFRRFSTSSPAVDNNDLENVALVTEIFSKPPRSNDEIMLELQSSNVNITHELILKVLKSLGAAPDASKRFFDWVSATKGEKLSSKSYNLMLGILGVNGLVDGFWELVDVMKKMGYGVSKGTQVKVFGKFEKEGMLIDAEKLKELYASGSLDNSIEKVNSKICKLIRQELWGNEVENRLRELNIDYSSDLVAMVLESLGTKPNKSLIFFRWVEESNLFKHDECTYNSMARVLGREDCVQKFWKVVNEMKDAGYEMEGKTYIEISTKFIRMEMIKEAVNLYVFAMDGANKPSIHDSIFLLKKIVVAKELDMELFGKVVKKYTDDGNAFANSSLGAVLKSLTSVDRYHECNKVLKTMKSGGGFLPGDSLQTKIAFKLSSKKKKEEAGEFLIHMEASGRETNHRTWASLVRGYCIAGDLEEASRSFRESIEKEGVSGAGYSLDLLVNEYCYKKRRAIDGFKLLTNSVKLNGVKPWHSTYKLLAEELLAQRNFNEALCLLGLMKNDGFPPFLDPFIKYVTKTGTTDDALMFLKGMTVKKFPSTCVVLRVFETYMKKGKHSEAQDLLSKCPSFIRNHADVLDLFYSMKPKISSSSSSSSVASVTC